MASPSQLTLHHGDDRTLRFQRVEQDLQRQALAVLLTGRPGESDSAVDHFLNYTRAQQLSLRELWAAWRGQRIEVIALLVPCAGRTGMLFLSPSASWPDGQTARRLVQTTCQAQDPSQVRLIQSLLEPQQRQARDALADSGFEQLALLEYMQRRAEPLADTPLPPDRDYTLLRWSEDNRPAFARAILASYEQTLDCPALRGVRPIDDIIAGHMAAGTFHPELWLAIYDGSEPVGVMLLNEAPASDAFELVYLGLSVPYRQRGLADHLMRHGLTRARDWGRARMILAVDERNTPAHRLYTGLGFRVTARRRAMVHIFDREASPAF